ncbi:MAG: type II toxin-antitoxin system RelE family toxin [Candidatus Acidiferrales bacterium]
MTASYDVSIKESATRELRTLPRNDLRRITRRIHALAIDPRPFGCEKLAGDVGYRIRQGDYRVVYTIDDEKRSVDILKIGHRREVYR